MPHVALIILSWNGKALTLACLASLAKLDYANHSLIVVDNGSTDGTVEAVRQGYPGVTLIENGANLGFAEGNNVGIRDAMERRAEYILLLNNDTEVAPDFLSVLVNAAERIGAGVYGPKIYYHAEPERIWCAGNTWTGTGFVQVGDGEPDGPAFGAEKETDYIIGCALFAPAQMFREIGLLDPIFFLTYEETDWCYRARRANYRCMVVPQSRIWHKVAMSMGGQGSPLQEYYYTRNLLLWAERYLPRNDFTALRREIGRFSLGYSSRRSGGSSWLKRFYWAANATLGRMRGHCPDPVAQARYWGFRDYLLRRFGICPDEVSQLKRQDGASSV
jgi:hypothetical protein